MPGGTALFLMNNVNILCSATSRLIYRAIDSKTIAVAAVDCNCMQVVRSTRCLMASAMVQRSGWQIRIPVAQSRSKHRAARRPARPRSSLSRALGADLLPKALSPTSKMEHVSARQPIQNHARGKPLMVMHVTTGVRPTVSLGA